MPEQFNWTDIEEIAITLAETHPEIDPTQVRFTDLRSLVESLDDFSPEPGQQVNEQILEAIQAAWIAENEDMQENDSEERSYKPNNPFR